MEILIEKFIKSVTLRAKAAFMIALGEKVIDLLKEDKNVFSLSRNLLDRCWLWEESLGASPREMYEYLDSSNEDMAKAETLSLICQFDNEETPEPFLTSTLTVINTGCIVVKYAYQVIDDDAVPPVIVIETSEVENIQAVADGLIKMNLVDTEWIN